MKDKFNSNANLIEEKKEEDFSEIITRLLPYIKEKYNMSQVDFAKKIGVSKKSISDWKTKGTTTARKKLVINFCNSYPEDETMHSFSEAVTSTIDNSAINSAIISRTKLTDILTAPITADISSPYDILKALWELPIIYIKYCDLAPTVEMFYVLVLEMSTDNSELLWNQFRIDNTDYSDEQIGAIRIAYEQWKERSKESHLIQNNTINIEYWKKYLQSFVAPIGIVPDIGYHRFLVEKTINDIFGSSPIHDGSRVVFSDIDDVFSVLEEGLEETVELGSTIKIEKEQRNGMRVYFTSYSPNMGIKFGDEGDYDLDFYHDAGFFSHMFDLKLKQVSHCERKI